MNPAALQKNAAMPGLVHQIAARQTAQIVHDLRQSHRMQPVAFGVAMGPVEIEAPGVASDAVLGRTRA